MEISYILTFALGATIGGLIVVFVVARCVVSAEARRKAADAVADAQWDVDETVQVSVGGTDE